MSAPFDHAWSMARWISDGSTGGVSFVPSERLMTFAPWSAAQMIACAVSVTALTVRSERPDGHDADLSGSCDFHGVVGDRADDACDTGPVVRARRVDVHRVRVAIDEVVAVRAIRRIRPHVRLNVWLGPPHAGVDDGDDDAFISEGDIPRGRHADRFQPPLVKEEGVAWGELGVDGKTRHEASRLRGRERGGSRNERAGQDEDRDGGGEPPGEGAQSGRQQGEASAISRAGRAYDPRPFINLSP